MLLPSNVLTIRYDHAAFCKQPIKSLDIQADRRSHFVLFTFFFVCVFLPALIFFSESRMDG